MISYVPWFITLRLYTSFFVFFFNDTATTEIYTLSLHDALPILIVSEDGYLLTNNHVVDGADEIKVAMSDEKTVRSEEHTSELQSPCNLVCRLLLEKKKVTPT